MTDKIDMQKVETGGSVEPVHAPVPIQEPTVQLVELALRNNADIAIIQLLVNLQDCHEAKHARKEFFAALSGFQADMPVVKKQGKAGFQHKQGGGSTSYTYAKLEDIAKAARPHMATHGLSYRYEIEGDGAQIAVHCIVAHKEGHYERTSMSGYADTSGKKNPIQQIASTQSYLRRYTFTGALGITVADEDDDAQALAAPSVSVSQTQTKPGYQWEAFDANFPKWEAALEEGKITRAQIIDMCNSKATLNSGQIKKINEIFTEE